MKSNFQFSQLGDRLPQVMLVAGVGIVVLHIAFNGVDTGAELRDRRNQTQNNAAALRVTQEELEVQAEIASERLKTGACILIATQQDVNLLPLLQEGTPVLDRATGQPLADKTCVFDYAGGTAIIREGVTAELARTGDDAVIKEAMEGVNPNASGLTPGQ